MYTLYMSYDVPVLFASGIKIYITVLVTCFYSYTDVYCVLYKQFFPEFCEEKNTPGNSLSWVSNPQPLHC